MQPLLGSDALERLTSGDVLVAFDYDGTLSPIVDRPEEATLRPQTRRLLARTAQLYPCVVISGRAEEDVQAKLSGVTVWYAVGNECLDDPTEIERRFRAVRRWVPRLRAAIGALPGVVIEDKGVSLAIHYRAAADAEQAAQAIREAAQALRRVRIVAGKQALHFLPMDGAAKRIALERVRARVGCEHALYFGDDGTDEEAFAAGGCVTGVRVGPSPSSSAPYYLRDQSEIDDVLERLVALRAPKPCVLERRRVR
jgi:trehalose 6-phosphate phosphatase